MKKLVEEKFLRLKCNIYSDGSFDLFEETETGWEYYDPIKTYKSFTSSNYVVKCLDKEGEKE